MQFLADNYFWFIIGGIVILMAVIGYFADKTDFGRKREEKKKTIEKEGTEANVVDNIVSLPTIEEGSGANTSVIDSGVEPISEDLYAPIGNTSIENSPVTDSVVEPALEDLYAPIDNTAIENSPVTDSVVEPASEDLYAPIDNTSTQNISETNGSTDLYSSLPEMNLPTNNNDLYAPLPEMEQPIVNMIPNVEQPVNIDNMQGVTEPIASEPIEEPVAIDVIPSTENVVLPSTDSEEHNINEDDDIWKF